MSSHVVKSVEMYDPTLFSRQRLRPYAMELIMTCERFGPTAVIVVGPLEIA